MMEVLKLKENEVFIRLGQALKAAGKAKSGVEAKYLVQEGRVRVNGETEVRRGRKLYDRDEFTLDDNETVRIEK